MRLIYGSLLIGEVFKLKEGAAYTRGRLIHGYIRYIFSKLLFENSEVSFFLLFILILLYLYKSNFLYMIISYMYNKLQSFTALDDWCWNLHRIPSHIHIVDDAFFPLEVGYTVNGIAS